MTIQLKRLEDSVAQIVLLLQKHTKVPLSQKQILIDILTKISNSQAPTNAEVAMFQALKDIDRKHFVGLPEFDKINHRTVYLSDWLMENAGMPLPAATKTRLSKILERVQNLDIYSDAEADEIVRRNS